MNLVPPSDDIPSLTLRVLERIQADLAGLRSEMKSELTLLNTRFDHFLGFVGGDVQDLKSRMTAVEDHLGLTRKQ